MTTTDYPIPPAIRPALTAADVAERLSLAPTAVYRLFRRKNHPLPHIRTGGIRVQPDTFERWLREEEQMSTRRKS
ncbi:helix-turn-helix domain-containing protein [Rhodococcus sp. NPDC058532]|uniref:helix-turn-helix domain-containing protein n=1 Tax=Rhodococcus sp. NPDC058532 TaxID=3346540 RepID=UPI0036605C15